MKIEKDLLSWVAFMVAIPIFITFYLHFFHQWSLQTVFNLVGIFCSLIGTLWIASGVLLSKEDEHHLINGGVKSKTIRHSFDLPIAASKKMPLAMIYIFAGAIFQSVVYIGAELKWFE